MARPSRSQLAARNSDIAPEQDDGGTLAQGFELLKMFSGQSPPKSVAEAADRIGTSGAKVERMIATFERHQLLEGVETGLARPGLGLLSLCRAAVPMDRAVGRLAQAVQSKAGRLPIRARLFAREGLSKFCVAVAGNDTESSFGLRSDLLEGYAGYALIWARPFDERHTLLGLALETRQEMRAQSLADCYLAFHQLELRSYCEAPMDANGGQATVFVPLNRDLDESQLVLNVDLPGGHLGSMKERDLPSIAIAIAEFLTE